MATLFPGATYRQLPRNYTARARKRTRGIVLHSTAAGKATSQYGWFSNASAGASSTWHVAKNGHVEQYMDADHIAWAQRSGDAECLSVEVQCSGYEPWTQAQCDAIARIIAWAAERYGFPIQMMSSSRASETGVGWHRQGVPASAAQKAAGMSQTGGELWSSAVGKICPGDPAISQIPGIVAAAKGAGGGAVGGSKPAAVSPFTGRLTWGYKAPGYESHLGMDIAPPVPGQYGPDQEVRAMRPGTVIFVETTRKLGDKSLNRAAHARLGTYATGDMVAVERNGFEVYNHVWPLVTVGQTVEAGDVIGYINRSGNQSGPHLHFETYSSRGVTYDPQHLFDKYGIRPGSAPAIAGPKPAPTTPISGTSQDTITIQEDITMRLIRRAEDNAHFLISADAFTNLSARPHAAERISMWSRIVGDPIVMNAAQVDWIKADLGHRDEITDREKGA